MSYKDLHWHEECFKCRKCKDSLVEKPFAGENPKHFISRIFFSNSVTNNFFYLCFTAKNALIFCANCYDEEFATRCDACGDTFRPGKNSEQFHGKNCFLKIN